MATITLKNIKDFFNYKTLSTFSQDWKVLPDHDREQIKTGIENGSLTY